MKRAADLDETIDGFIKKISSSYDERIAPGQPFEDIETFSEDIDELQARVHDGSYKEAKSIVNHYISRFKEDHASTIPNDLYALRNTLTIAQTRANNEIRYRA